MKLMNLMKLKMFLFLGLVIVLENFFLEDFLQAETTTIKIDGSSTVYPITEAVAEKFQVEEKGRVHLTVGTSGTGGGFKKFCRGETDIQNASRPIKESEIKDCSQAGVKFLELPIAFDAIVIAINPQNDWISDISIDDLKKIWEPEAQGRLLRWNQLNPKWPNEKIKLYGAGSDSGTFDYFTEAVVGKAGKSRGDYASSENDNTLVTGIAHDKYALGYIPLSYYLENKFNASSKSPPTGNSIKALGVLLKDKKTGQISGPIFPTIETVKEEKYKPFSRPLFIYVSENSLNRPEVINFVKFYLANAESLVSEVGEVPLPGSAYKIVLEKVEKKKLGTLFDGNTDVGINIDQLLKKEIKAKESKKAK